MVELREMAEADLGSVLSWRNQEGVRKNMYTSHVISMEEHRAWWNSQKGNPRTVLLIAEIEGVSVGVVTFTQYTGVGGTATWAFYAAEAAPRGVGSKMEYAALNYAFEKLKLRKLECEVLSFNMAVVNLHVRHGFEIEGVFKQAYERDGQFFDIYRLALLANTWLKYLQAEFAASGNGKIGLVGKTFSSTALVSEQKVNDFVAASGDRNPVHIDDEQARAQGFNGRIAHGMLTASLLSEIFANHFPGPGTVYLGQTLEFLRPVSVGVEVTSTVKVIGQVGRRLTVECHQYCGDELCVSGTARLLLAKA